MESDLADQQGPPKRRRLTKRADAQAAETLQSLQTLTEPDYFDSDTDNRPSNTDRFEGRVPKSVSRLLNTASGASRPHLPRGQLTARGRRRRGSGMALQRQGQLRGLEGKEGFLRYA